MQKYESKLKRHANFSRFRFYEVLKFKCILVKLCVLNYATYNYMRYIDKYNMKSYFMYKISIYPFFPLHF